MSRRDTMDLAEFVLRIGFGRNHIGGCNHAVPSGLEAKRQRYGRPRLPLLISAAAGGLLLLKQRPREGFTLVLLAWAVVWIGYTVLEFLTPIEMRLNLAAALMSSCLGM